MKDMRNYIVILPEGLPVESEVDYSVKRTYDTVPKRGSTTAPTEIRAVTNLVFRACSNRNDAKRISSYLLDRMEKCEVYEVPEVENTDGSALSFSDRKKAEEIFLADDIAERRQIDKLDALQIAREYLNTLVRVR